MSLLSGCAALLLASSAAIAQGAGTDEPWYEHYEKGIAALNAQYWGEAIEQLTRAIEARPDPGVQLRTRGMNFVDYHPYFRLGLAYFNLGQFGAALRAFDTEERLGAISRSPGELRNLRTFHRLAQEGVRTAVTGSLEEARAFERKGQMDRALAALGKGLAADRENAEALAAVQRLRDLVAVEERERALEALVTSLTSRSAELIRAGEYARASASLQKALTLKPNQSIQSLLVDTQEKLRLDLQARLDPGSREALVERSLAEVARLESAGRIDEAVEGIQPVLALEPRNQRAMATQYRLLRAQVDEGNRRSREEAVARLVNEGERFLREGLHAEAVAAFNRALALDPAEPTARSSIWRAYSSMHQELPVVQGGNAGPKLPPVIAFVNAANTVDREERRYEQVASPDFSLRGVILSSQAEVEVDFYLQPEGGGGDEAVAVADSPLAVDLVGDLYQHTFDQRFTLPRGPATLILRVVDERGLISEARHRVRYLRPWSGSPLFYAALALTGVGVIGGLQGYRVQRRNRLLKRRFNPFVAGAPVLDEDLFIGRERLLARILETVHNNSVLLYGERRIGKTSLQHHLKRRLERLRDPDYDFYPVYIDLQGTPQERFFVTMAEDIFEGLSSFLDDARPGQDLPADAAYTYQTFIRDVRRVLAVLKERSPKKVKLVLLIDEVDELNSYDPRINQKLRSLFMKSFAEDLVAVVSGVGIKKHWASEGSPWYNFFEEIEVKPFTREDAEELIQRPIRGVFKLGEGALDRLIENTDCKPYLIQKVSMALVNRMHDAKRRIITVADVDAIGRPKEA